MKMRKKLLLLLVLGLCIPGMAHAYTAFVAFDNSMSSIVVDISAIELGVNGSSATFANGYLVTDSININGGLYTNGALPEPLALGNSWVVLPGGDFVTVADFTIPGPTPASAPGVAASIDAVDFFTVDINNIFDQNDLDITSMFTIDDGVAITSAIFSGSPVDGDMLYTISQVPIPSAVWLLAPGLLALIGLRRRNAHR
ncbi:MAG: VPLPA-CTERM sorting domain-containing protein [Desulfosarcinaceae bacterium]|nr:VPLPA-CTERM sorting domain-containing protein [Desulfosarcinaceae bacterium]